MTEEQLSALLRIKRFEQPPPQYFDRLLQDIHHRQRSELLRRPLWKIAAERVQTFFSEHSMGHLSYAGALASALVVGVVGIGLMTSGGAVDRAPGNIGLAVAAPQAMPQEKLLDIQNSRPQLAIGPSSVPAVQPVYAPLDHQPRYIIDARPVIYELPNSY